MKEVKTPRKPLAIYYAIVLLTLLLLPQWKLQKVVSTKNSKLSLLKVLHLS